MITTVKPKLSLEEFLQQPETKPASEFINSDLAPTFIPRNEMNFIANSDR